MLQVFAVGHMPIAGEGTSVRSFKSNERHALFAPGVERVWGRCRFAGLVSRTIRGTCIY